MSSAQPPLLALIASCVWLSSCYSQDDTTRDHLLDRSISVSRESVREMRQHRLLCYEDDGAESFYCVHHIVYERVGGEVRTGPAKKIEISRHLYEDLESQLFDQLAAPDVTFNPTADSWDAAANQYVYSVTRLTDGVALYGVGTSRQGGPQRFYHMMDYMMRDIYRSGDHLTADDRALDLRYRWRGP
jgi:hypothetical protein